MMQWPCEAGPDGRRAWARLPVYTSELAADT